MRALTLTQPWAQLMADERKRIETRSWQPPLHMAGQVLAIHAAKGWQAVDRDCAETYGYEPGALPRGAILAMVRLRDWIPVEDARPAGEYEYGDYTPGRWAWITEFVYKLPEPIPCRGALGLWEVPTEIAAQLLECYSVTCKTGECE